MKYRQILLAAVLLMFVFGFWGVRLVVAQDQVAEGWFAAGSNPADYKMGVERAIVHSGRAGGFIKSNVPDPKGFATLMQMSKAGAYTGKRVRMTGYVKSAEVEDWAGLWMRVDGPEGKELAFDNMLNRAINGTSEWTKYSIVLDVPMNSLEIAFGILLEGRGKAWIDDVKFEVVGKDVPSTDTQGQGGERIFLEPKNLDFEDF